MVKKMGQAWFKDYQRGCSIQVISIAIAIPLLCLCIFVPLFFANRPGVSSEASLWIMVVPASLFLLIMFGGGFGAIFYSIRRRTKWLDEAFASFGLEGSSYAVIGRQYHGTYRGREIDINFARGPMFNLYLSTPLQTRVSISDKEDVSKTLTGLFNKEPLEIPEAEQKKLTVFAEEEEWGTEFITHPDVIPIANGLIREEHPFLFRYVQLNPGVFLLRLYRSKKMLDFQFTPEQAKHWVAELFRLAEIAESLSPPQEEIPIGELEHKLRKGTSKINLVAWGIVLVIILGGLCAAGVALLFIFFIENGGA